MIDALIFHRFKSQYYYFLQTKFAKVMFLQVSVCPQQGGACMVAGGGGVVACVFFSRGGGMHGFFGGRAWFFGGHAWFFTVRYSQ